MGYRKAAHGAGLRGNEELTMTDPLTDILRLGASAEVADAWIALGDYLATVQRPETPQLARLLLCYRRAIGAHEVAVARYEEMIK